MKGIGLFIFGLNGHPKPLPAGWHYEAAADAFLQAVSPDGKVWLVCSHGVVRWRAAVEADVAKALAVAVGEMFADVTETIIWPEKP